MGKLSITGFLVRAAKIALCYFYIIPVFFGMLCEGLFEILGLFPLEEKTRLIISLVVQLIITFIPAIVQSMLDGHKDSFYGRYSLISYSLIAFVAMIVYIAIDQLPNVKICPIWNVFFNFYLPVDLFSTLYFILMFGLIVLFYYIGRRNALYENAEAVYKTEKSIAEEEKAKAEKAKELSPSQSQPERKTGTWRDSIRGDE